MQATDALYGEVERLSKSWEDVANQANSKVLNLKEMEEKVSKLATEVRRPLYSSRDQSALL